ncbi:MAG: dephospho-CoA kinase [Rothia sp. (in: high G+C Gram-positive bacteria)]|nr:dephospho-CoA kinase [Rothia sp. (in: high G+C Gram-positive bacteria)]
MKRIGLTGGIGSGKSTVAAMFAELGAVIIDADAISRELMEPGQAVLAQTVAEFGQGIVGESGELNRAALASIVFADERARERLNAIVHPAVRAESQRIADEALRERRQESVIIEDIPLLTETGQANRFDAVIVVFAREEVRLHRLVHDRKMHVDDARARIRAQASDDERAEIATWTIDNSDTLESTQQQVQKIWAEITTRRKA